GRHVAVGPLAEGVHVLVVHLVEAEEVVPVVGVAAAAGGPHGLEGELVVAGDAAFGDARRRGLGVAVGVEAGELAGGDGEEAPVLLLVLPAELDLVGAERYLGAARELERRGVRLLVLRGHLAGEGEETVGAAEGERAVTRSLHVPVRGRMHVARRRRVDRVVYVAVAEGVGEVVGKPEGVADGVPALVVQAEVVGGRRREAVAERAVEAAGIALGLVETVVVEEEGAVALGRRSGARSRSSAPPRRTGMRVKAAKQTHVSASLRGTPDRPTTVFAHSPSASPKTRAPRRGD